MHGTLQIKVIGVQKTGHVALVEIRRPPHNFFDVALIKELASAFEALDADADCRALVLAAQGKAFCAGADFGGDDSDGSALLSGPRPGAAHLYVEGNRLFRTKKPIVAALKRRTPRSRDLTIRATRHKGRLNSFVTGCIAGDE